MSEFIELNEQELESLEGGYVPIWIWIAGIGFVLTAGVFYLGYSNGYRYGY